MIVIFLKLLSRLIESILIRFSLWSSIMYIY